MDVGVQYLSFKISYVKFPYLLSLNEYSTHYHEQCGGCLIEINQI